MPGTPTSCASSSTARWERRRAARLSTGETRPSGSTTGRRSSGPPGRLLPRRPDRNARSSGPRMHAIPSFATHYYLAGRAPFLNLSDLSDDAVDAVMSELETLRDDGLRRVFGRRYMELRRLTEARLRELFVEAGGAPERRAPHYFVLGSSDWYRALFPDTREVRVELAQLPEE